MLTFGTKKNAEKCQEFICIECNFKCSKKSNYESHLATRKHKILTNTYNILTKNAEKTPKLYTCECGNSYKHRQSLNNHRQKCPIIHAEVQENVQFVQSAPVQESMNEEKVVKLVTNTVTTALTSVVPLIMNGNKEMIVDVVKEVVKKDTTTNNNSHNTTNNNQTFNLQLFLNEDCKNAMNITDFVKNLQIDTSDFERLGDVGHAEGISRMLIKGLSELDITERPIHCSDAKREVIHIKDQDKWEKDTDKVKLKKAIQDISNRNMMVMDDWKTENPGCTEYDNAKNDMYMKLMVQSLTPLAEEKDFKKIIKSVAKNTIIDKEEIR